MINVKHVHIAAKPVIYLETKIGIPLQTLPDTVTVTLENYLSYENYSAKHEQVLPVQFENTKV